jgi:Domain of unknown function (DUF3597)
LSIFGQIMGAIFGHKGTSPTATSATTQTSGAPPLQPTSSTSPAGIDVEAVLSERASQTGERLNWKHSIVDLMKLLGLDSSLSARKQLAQELGYTGELNGSAEMNMWLHKQVMKKLAENGGKVSAELTH